MNTFSDFAIHHPLLTLAAFAVAISALCCGLAELFNRIDDRLETRRTVRDLEDYANAPENHARKEKPQP